MNRTTSVFLSAVLFASTLSGCVAAAGAAGAEAGYVASQKDRSVGETIDDQVILSSLKSRYLADPEVPGLKINVDVNKGIVTLRGYLKSEHQITRAIQLAEETKGVKAVDSRLVLDSAS